MAAIPAARLAAAMKGTQPKVIQPDDMGYGAPSDRGPKFVPNPKTNPGATGKQAQLNKQRPARGTSSYS